MQQPLSNEALRSVNGGSLFPLAVYVVLHELLSNPIPDESSSSFGGGESGGGGAGADWNP